MRPESIPSTGLGQNSTGLALCSIWFYPFCACHLSERVAYWSLHPGTRGEMTVWAELRGLPKARAGNPTLPTAASVLPTGSLGLSE